MRPVVADFRDRPGIIEAEIVEEAGRILMRKACEKHGPFEDVLSNHPDFFKRMESLGFGKDFNCAGDEMVHNHGANSIRTGRGTYLIVDLTNRCNMFCSPCYMDANAASYVHELDMQDVTALFERATSFKPQREINVLFSGGEATLSPIFLDAIRHAKSVGFHRLHVATNGIRFAQEKDFAVKAKAAGLHAVYLQFDGVTEEKNGHRGIGNYMEVKRRALDNIAAAGMKTTLQVTVENGLNNDGVGDIIRFVADHIEKIHGIIFQPVMFSGRDEDISADERYARRYPVSQIAYDLQAQTSFGWEPMRDWFPVSAYAVFANLCDVLHPEAALGSLFCDIHPNQGMFSPILINSRTREIVPVAKFFDVEQFLRDIVEITDLGRGPAITKAMVAISAVRNFDRTKAPADFGLDQLRRLLVGLFLSSCRQRSKLVGAGLLVRGFLETGDDYPDELPGSLQLRPRNNVRFKDSRGNPRRRNHVLCIQRRSLAKDRGALAPDRELGRMESDAWPASNLRQRQRGRFGRREKCEARIGPDREATNASLICEGTGRP